MMAPLSVSTLAILSHVLATTVQAAFKFEAKHTCGVCREIISGEPCERYGACHLLNITSVAAGCDSFCTVPDRAHSLLHKVQANGVEVRVAKGFGTKGYDLVRISVISSSPTPPIQGFFDYSEQFRYKWTDNYLHTALKKVTPGDDTHFNVGSDIIVNLPAKGAGVAGVLIADPCVLSSLGWIGCDFGNKFQTSERTPGLINAFVGDKDMNFWGIFGDNLYDRTGVVTKPFFNKISMEAKSKIFATVPGNHDYWVLGGPDVSTLADQCGNGFMQFYAQDSKAAEMTKPGDSTAPFDFSVDPDSSPLHCKAAAMHNFFWYNQVGNVGMVGQSGAYSLEEAMPFMQEACSWLSQQDGLEVALLLGHWDVSGYGASSEMAMPQWYEEMAALPGCSAFNERGMLKFAMGHTHCNDPHPHGKVGSGFRVAGFGMGGCGNFGMPIVDTTGGRVRFWYFDTSSDKLYNSVVTCVTQKGWRQCVDLATLWLDEPISKGTSPRDQVVV